MGNENLETKIFGIGGITFGALVLGLTLTFGGLGWEYVANGRLPPTKIGIRADNFKNLDSERIGYGMEVARVGFGILLVGVIYEGIRRAFEPNEVRRYRD